MAAVETLVSVVKRLEIKIHFSVKDLSESLCRHVKIDVGRRDAEMMR
jgi:hypothetical protein